MSCNFRACVKPTVSPVSLKPFRGLSTCAAALCSYCRAHLLGVRAPLPQRGYESTAARRLGPWSSPCGRTPPSLAKATLLAAPPPASTYIALLPAALHLRCVLGDASPACPRPPLPVWLRCDVVGDGARSGMLESDIGDWVGQVRANDV